MNRSIFKKLPLRQLPELDAIRFLSILLVVLHHQFFDQNFILAWFGKHGWVGVDIFFVMSGFLITTTLLKEQTTKNKINLKLFWYRRILRLWPSWLMTLALSFIMVFFISRNQPVLREALNHRWWHYFLHFGNYDHAYLGQLHTLFSHFWSLSVEEHFYLFWPLLLIGLRTRKQLIMAISILIIVPLLFRYYYITNGHTVYVISLPTHTRMDEILFGCLLALYFPRIKDLALGAEVFLTGIMLALFYVALYHGRLNYQSSVLYSLTYTMCGIASCLLVILALKGGEFGLRRLLKIKLFAKLGVLSYGVYLIHFHMNFIVYSLLSKFSITDNQTLIAAVNFTVPFIPAYFMYFYIDEFFAKFKRH
jgi:peptidoglycan/LPS O-acetylase OafA/YrhL